jgi:GT2 family glycosyltransferase
LNLSIVTVNWNTRDLLGECIASARADAAGMGLRHWVVDNASEDGSAAFLREKFPEVRLIEMGENAGFARACNRALAEGARDADAVLFLNPDTVSGSGAIPAMARALAENPEAGAVTCVLTDATGRFQEAQGNRMPSPRTAFNTYFFLNRIFSDAVSPGIYWARKPAGRGPVEVEWLSGAAMMVRREALPAGPFFDERYFLYAEDMEASAALRREGWKLLLLPGAFLSHLVKQSTKKSPPWVFRTQVTSQIDFLSRHATAVDRSLIRFFMLAGHVLRAVIHALSVPVRGRAAAGRAARHWRLAAAVAEGVR